MEHLSRPHSPVEDQIQVPYIGMKAYDREAFVDYPAREGWHKGIELISRETRSNFQADWPLFTAFLQRWLFMGLLHSFFLNDFSERDYIHVDSPGELFLTTATLNDKLLSLKDFELSGPVGWEDRLRSRDECLRQARMALIGLPKTGEIDGRVLLSLLVLYETLAAINSSIQLAAAKWTTEDGLREGTKLLKALQREPWQEPLPDKIRQNVVDAVTSATLQERFQGPDEMNAFIYETGIMMRFYESPAVGLPGSMVNILKDRFQARGWCPRDIQMITQNCNATTQLYMLQLDRPGKLKDHESKHCQVEECHAYHISASDYRTEHAMPGCCCEDVVVDTNRVESILQKNRVPVIAVDTQEDGSFELTVVESHSDVEYIAFSHVWSDGLGNNWQNALPSCQIARLYRYCSQTRPSIMPFWIDTLCCPRKPPEARARAIRLMRKTYEEAAVVVVIDAWLDQQKCQSISNVESMMRIALSGWTRRLWTFQEGSINRNVSIVFNDKVVDLDSHSENLKFYDHPSVLPMTRYLLTVHEELRTIHLSQSHDVREKFRRLIPCFRYRGTSWASDEPICLAVIFALDVEPVWKASKEDRMKEFWGALENIPPDVVFFDAPKCSQEGFRWAPASLLGGKQNQRFSNIHHLTMPPAQKTSSGLIVNLSGFVLSTELNKAITKRAAAAVSFSGSTCTSILDEKIANGRRHPTRGRIAGCLATAYYYIPRLSDRPLAATHFARDPRGRFYEWRSSRYVLEDYFPPIYVTVSVTRRFGGRSTSS